MDKYLTSPNVFVWVYHNLPYCLLLELPLPYQGTPMFFLGCHNLPQWEHGHMAVARLGAGGVATAEPHRPTAKQMQLETARPMSRDTLASTIRTTRRGTHRG